MLYISLQTGKHLADAAVIPSLDPRNLIRRRLRHFPIYDNGLSLLICQGQIKLIQFIHIGEFVPDAADPAVAVIKHILPVSSCRRRLQNIRKALSFRPGVCAVSNARPGSEYLPVPFRFLSFAKQRLQRKIFWEFPALRRVIFDGFF